MPFEKGKSGNPGGRPKSKEATSALRKVLLEHADQNFKLSKGARRIDVVAMRLVKSAVDGDVQAIKEIFNRLEGRPVQPIAGWDENEGPKELVVRFARPNELSNEG